MSARMKRGFTLVELLIAGAVGLVILTTAVAYVVATERAYARRLKLAAMRRESARIVDGLTTELRQAGLGVPQGSKLEGSHAAFPSRTLVLATASSIGFLADVSRPDTSLNGLSWLTDDETTGMPGNGIALMNEQNGGCDVSMAPLHCQTNQSTALFAPSAGGCHLSASARTCPWGLSRYRSNEFVLLSDGAGHWVERQVSGALITTSASRRTLDLTVAPHAQLRAEPKGGFLSTPDRIFYRDNGSGALERHQCWGSVGSPTIASLGPCLGAQGTPWEQLASLANGGTLTFSYFDDTGAAIAAPVAAAQLPLVARVDLALHLVRMLGPDVIMWDTTTSVAVGR